MDSKKYIQVNTPEYWKATIALGIGSFLIFSNMHMAQPLLPLFSRDFGVSAATSSLAVSMVTFSLSIFLLFFGPLSDAVGRKNIMSLGLLMSALFSIFIFFVPNFTALIILRTFQGIFLASLPAVAYAYIGEEFEGNSVGVVIGIYISGNSIGGMGGRIISGYIADTFGWKYSFLIIGIIGLLSFALFSFLLPKSNNFKPKKLSRIKAAKAIIVHWKNPVLRKAYYIAGIIFSIFIGLFNYLGYHLSGEPYNLSTTVIGLLYLTYIAGTFSSTFSGHLAGALTISTRVLLGLIMMFSGLVLMFFTPLILIFFGLIIMVFGFFFAHSAASSWVSYYAKEAKASASALYLFSYYMGGSIGSFLLGYVWSPFGFLGVVAFTILLVLIGLITALKMKTIEKN